MFAFRVRIPPATLVFSRSCGWLRGTDKVGLGVGRVRHGRTAVKPPLFWRRPRRDGALEKKKKSDNGRGLRCSASFVPELIDRLLQTVFF